MLDIPFRKNREPLTDGEILAVVDTIRPVLVAGRGPDVMIAWLLAKILFRIEQLRAEAGLPPINRALRAKDPLCTALEKEPA